jgi:hypothetical protein
VRPPRSRFPRWVLLLLGAAAVVSVLAADPAVLGLLLDADFLAASAAVGLALLGHDVRLWARRATSSLPVLWWRVGFRLTHERPGSLLA